MRHALGLCAAMGLAACAGGGDPGPDREPPAEATAASLSFGEVRRVCGPVSGQPVARAPKRGRAVWTLYDSAPGTIGGRPQYISGFADGCARQVTGALVLFGSPGLHEAARYDASMAAPYSATDTAYEVIKAQSCGVGSGVPCPPGRIDELEGRLTFVTVYPNFGSGRERLELLLHDGALVAQAVVR